LRFPGPKIGTWGTQSCETPTLAEKGWGTRFCETYPSNKNKDVASVHPTDEDLSARTPEGGHPVRYETAQSET